MTTVTAQTPYQATPRVTAQSPIGPVVLAFTDAGHVHVSCDAHVNDRKPAVVWRGEDYLPSIHLYAADGWESKPGDRPHVTRRSNWSDAPRTYRDGIVATLAAFVREYVAQHPEVLAEAELAATTNALREALAEQAKAAQALSEAKDAVAIAQAHYIAAIERRDV